MNTFTLQTISIQKIQSRILLFLAIILIPNCVAQTPSPTSPTTSPPTKEEKEFYEDLDTLKYIAIAALLVLICCCLALIIFVRRQVRKTEQGTEIQQYIRKKNGSSADISGHGGNGMLAASQSGNRPKLSWDQSNTLTQTHTHNGHGSNANLYGHNGHGSNMNIKDVGQAQTFPNHAISLDSTPGQALGGAYNEEDDVKKEVQIINMVEKQKFRENMKKADDKDKIEDFKEEDDYFKDDLKYKIDRLQSEENKMFNEMERENLKNQQNNYNQQNYAHIDNGKGYHP